ncbi:hypothetical protein [Hymenobacter sp. CRA2]|uniref:hypothetical protein n=1 Tax=Hymenobacter sp. CRA2 TaxID=1955620 RepID=UPI00098FA414|nr:hypothetical protein [Hymenobacter sp. CRA2]OON68459.1 hypothetical protein B0919_12470 [Hymenobacter sp. CRA2]
MNPKEFARHVKQTCVLYKHWNITTGQAEAIVRFQQDQDLIQGFWESTDFEYENFQRILTPAQWPLYLSEYEQAMAEHEQRLHQQDAQAAAQLPVAEQMLDYYRREIGDTLQQLTLKRPLSSRQVHKDIYVLEEYRQFLKRKREALLSDHYREYRRLAPQVLQLALLRHSLLEHVPALREFGREADEATKAILHYVLAEVGRDLQIMYEKELADLEQRLESFNKQVLAGPRSHWLFAALHAKPANEAERYHHWAFWLLWLDRDRIMKSALEAR